MQAFYDLHIHSALSPCADDDMTPNNIVNMARLKQLDIIAVTDHNSAENIPAVQKVAAEAGLAFIPGIELNTAEEVHLLALFADAEAALACGREVYGALPAIPNKPDFFGNQLVMDENDEVIGTLDKLLISALPYSIDECFELVFGYGGHIMPAHVNKGANSVFANLGFMPPHLPVRAVEVFSGAPEMGDVSEYFVTHSSDAHNLWVVSERENSVEVETVCAQTVLEKIFG
ncbi:MAG: PHP domain-containing protein [Christensenellaceae bacterium]|jgi:hypothetical protein